MALAALLALVFVLSASIGSPMDAGALPPPSPAPVALDAMDGSGSACTGQPAFKAVIVVGPVGGETTRFKGWADEIAAAAKDAGMAVCKVYTPYADDDTVKRAAKGADLFVALMHGSGYPRPDRTKADAVADLDDKGSDGRNGLGLNASRGSGDVRYHGADWVRRYLRLAPNAIVILSHMCYTSGNSEDFHKLPSYALAVEHVDNFAAGFLDSGSYPSGGHPSAVMAIQSQHFDPNDRKGNLISTLMTRDVTLDRAFMTTYTRNTGRWEGTFLPGAGAIGSTDFYVTRRPDGSDLRSRGRIHMDPDLLVDGRTPSLAALDGPWDPHAPDIAWLDRFAGRPKGITKGPGRARFGYVRAITGDLTFDAADWRAGAAQGTDGAPDPSPPDDPAPGAETPRTVAIPRIRGLTRSEAKARLIAAGLRVSTRDLSARNDAVRKGRALNTHPSYLLPDGAARKVRRGTTVRIRLSTGPGRTGKGTSPATTPTGKVIIPRVRGLSVADARARLVAAGLRVSSDQVDVASTVVPRGRAVNTYPSYLLDGEPRSVVRGTVVRIKVSTGP